MIEHTRRLETFTCTCDEMGLSQDTEDPSIIVSQDHLWASANRTSKESIYGLGALKPKYKHLTTERQRLAQMVEQQQANIETLSQQNLRVETTLEKVLAQLAKLTRRKKRKKDHNGDS